MCFQVKRRTAGGASAYGSHVMQYGDVGLNKDKLDLYMGTNPANDNFTFVDANSLTPPSGVTNQRDADLVHFWDKVPFSQSSSRILDGAEVISTIILHVINFFVQYRKAPEGSTRKTEAQKQVLEAMSHRLHVDNSVKLVGKLLFGISEGSEVLNKVRPAGQPLADDWTCLKNTVNKYIHFYLSFLSSIISTSLQSEVSIEKRIDMVMTLLHLYHNIR